MKPIKFPLWLAAAALLAFGCAPVETTSKPAAEGPNAANQSVEPSAAGTSEPTKSGPSTDEVPADLKSAGYSYFGLENAKVQTFNQVSGPNGDQEAGQQTTYLGVVDGEHTFRTTRTGAAATIGDSELIVRKDGLYTSKVGGNKLEKPSLEVPADLKPGSAWRADSSFKIKVDGVDQMVSQHMAFKAVGTEKVKTKAGEFDALKIVGSGTMKMGERSGKNQTSMWFVKNVGLVKMSITQSNDGVDQKMTMDLVSQK